MCLLRVLQQVDPRTIDPFPQSYIHEHPLFPTSEQYYQAQNREWQCDICQKTSTELGQTQSYYCTFCEFELCVSCFQEKNHPIHVHPLRLADISIVYPQTNGRWECDVCGTTSRLNERYAYHCDLGGALCDFDCCLNCFKERQSPLHVHPLVRADSHVVYSQFSGGWKCDNCGSLHMGSDNNKPWHCTICYFDLCNSCMRGERQDQVPMNWTTSVTNSETKQTTEFNKPDECVICLSKPRNATLVHGDTGHFCCCWQCAQTLKNRGDHCPICRAPIDHVIKQFSS